jgi:hypothetical protein
LRNLDVEQDAFGGSYVDRTSVIPTPVPDTTVGTGQYGNAEAVSENTEAASLGVPYLFGRVSNSAPGYDFSGLFGNSQEVDSPSIIERIVLWLDRILS